jgi:phage-related protein
MAAATLDTVIEKLTKNRKGSSKEILSLSDSLHTEFLGQNTLLESLLGSIKNINTSLLNKAEDQLKLTQTIFTAKQEAPQEQNTLLESLLGSIKDINTSLLGSIKNINTSLLNKAEDQYKLNQTIFRAEQEALQEQKTEDNKGSVPKDDTPASPKSGGFFSKLTGAIMNPLKSMGKGIKSIGKGIEGFLVGLSRGLASFANPLVLIGVTVMAVSLPIFAAGLASAFKVFEMIAGEGKALKFVTGVIKALGEVIGDILHKVLTGFGTMVKNMGPNITLFFDGLANVVKALTPIITSLFTVIKDIITDPVLNETIQTVIQAISTAITDIKELVIEFAPVIESVLNKLGDVIISITSSIEKVVATMGGVVNKIFDTFDSVVGKIEPLVKQVGDSIVQVINGIVKGISELANLDAVNMAAVAIGIAAIGAALIPFAAGAASVTLATNEGELSGIANGIQKFGNIKGANLKEVGDGIMSLSKGLGAFAAATAGGQVGNLLGGAADAVGGFFGLGEDDKEEGKVSKKKDPANQFEKFAKMGPGLKQAGEGVSGLAQAFNTFNASDPSRSAKALNTFMKSIDMKTLRSLGSASKGLSALSQMNYSGQELINAQRQQNNLSRETSKTTVISSTTQQNISNSSGVVLPPSAVVPGNGGGLLAG